MEIRVIYGIGTDIVEIQRVVKAVRNTPRFLERYYTERERLLIQERGGQRRERTAAVNFAGKEAVSKALQTGITGQVCLEEIEILRTETGAPCVNLYGKTRQYAEAEGITKIHISLSDTDTLAAAYAVAEK